MIFKFLDFGGGSPPPCEVRGLNFSISLLISFPFQVTDPEEGFKRPDKIWSKLVFPLALAPFKIKPSPCFREKLILEKTVLSFLLHLRLHTANIFIPLLFRFLVVYIAKRDSATNITVLYGVVIFFI